MRVRALDANGDWTFGKGQNDYKFGRDAAAQAIGTRLKSFTGDCFFDIGAGIDWWNLLGSKNRLALELAISNSILNTPGVTRIVPNTFSSTLDADRNLSVSCQVDTVFGVVTVSEGLNINYLLTESGEVLSTEGGSGLGI